MSDLEAFRIAIRKEGMFVNAYLALPGTMEGAALVASVRCSVCDIGEPAVFEAFKEFVKGPITKALVAELGGMLHSVEERPAT